MGGFPNGSDGKESSCNAETQVLMGRGDPLEKGMAALDRGAWRATVPGVERTGHG